MIIVYGDIMLDRWIVGNADRISPEAPVPVLLEESQHFSIGGAGNLALNIQSINGQVKLFGSVGQDKEGYKLLEMLEDTEMIEVKQGPFAGEVDKKRFKPKDKNSFIFKK